MRVVAYVHGPRRVHELGAAFAAGCKRHGVRCDIAHVDKLAGPVNADVVWLYGMGPARPVFDAYEGRATRLIGDRGYWNEYLSARRFFRVSIDAQQPDAHLQFREHSPRRFDSFGIKVRPVDRRGDYILLCGMGLKQAQMVQRIEYGEWETRMYESLRAVTRRPILVREKPKCPPIPGLPRSKAESPSAAIRGAWAVVCNTGNVGADCVLEGVPVVAMSGPGKVYGRDYIDGIDQIKPLHPDDRLAALADIAHWHWTADEMRAGLLWDNLVKEGAV